MSFLCIMNLRLLLVFAILVTLSSCTSEYDERLEQARKLQDRYLMVEESNMVAPSDELLAELNEIQNEIDFLAKISGNEHLFLKELNDY